MLSQVYLPYGWRKGLLWTTFTFTKLGSWLRFSTLVQACLLYVWRKGQSARTNVVLTLHVSHCHFTNSKLTIMLFEVIVDCNLQTDCPTRSVKTSSDSKEKKSICEFLIFRIFWKVSENFKNLFSHFPVSFYETFFWLGLCHKTATTVTKNSNQSQRWFLGKVFAKNWVTDPQHK